MSQPVVPGPAGPRPTSPPPTGPPPGSPPPGSPPPTGPRPTGPPPGSPPPDAPGRAGPLGGVAAGLALVLIAVLVGVVVDQVTGVPRGGGTVAAGSGAVAPTGHTTTVELTAEGMRYRPDRIQVPAGDRLIIELTNRDNRRHDLVLSSGTGTPIVGRAGSVRLDAGIIATPVTGWCSLPGHRAAGMTLEIIPTGASGPAAGHADRTRNGPGQGGQPDQAVLPEPGNYPFISHVMVDAERGAHDLIEVR